MPLSSIPLNITALIALILINIFVFVIKDEDLSNRKSQASAGDLSADNSKALININFLLTINDILACPGWD